MLFIGDGMAWRDSFFFPGNTSSDVTASFRLLESDEFIVGIFMTVRDVIRVEG
ncbi:10186_t:CDS:2, partial [Ambispora leptoticha]